MKYDQDDLIRTFINAWMSFRRLPYHRRDECMKPSALRLLINLIRRPEPGASQELTLLTRSISELSHALQVTSPTVTQLVTQLENEGLVKRQMDPKDRRSVQVKLTQQGFELMNQQRMEFFQKMKKLVDYLGVDESKQFIHLMEKMTQYFQNNGDD